MKKSYASLFIELGKYAAVTTFIIGGLVTTAAIAASGNGMSLDDVNLKTTGVQLAIKSPTANICPSNAKMAGWIQTNRPGEISYMIARKGGAVSGPFTLDAVKSVNGGMASFDRDLDVRNSIDAEYRILVEGENGMVASSWVPLKASCKIKLTG